MRGRALGQGIGWVAKLTPWLFPSRLLIVPDFVVLAHPRPTSNGHVLLLPRNRTAGLDGPLSATASAVNSMLNEVAALATANFEQPQAVIAVVNGGLRQDVRLLHMHLLADRELAEALCDAERHRFLAADGRLATARPLQSVHVIYDRTAIQPEAFVADVLRNVAARRMRAHSIMARAVVPSIVHLVGSVDDRPGNMVESPAVVRLTP